MARVGSVVKVKAPKGLAGVDLTGAPKASAAAVAARPLADLSTPWADAVVQRQAAAGAPLPDHSETVAWLESLGVKMMQAELRNLAQTLTRLADGLTPDRVMVLAEKARNGRYIPALKVTGISPDGCIDPGGWAQAHTRVSIDPETFLGQTLMVDGVAPRAIPAPKAVEA